MYYKIKTDLEKMSFQKKQPSKNQIKKIKHDRRNLGINSKKIELAKIYYLTPENKNFNSIQLMLESFFDDMIEFGENDIIGHDKDDVYNKMFGFSEDEPESVVALCNYIFSEYMLADSFYYSLKELEEDFKHYCEEKWDKSQLKLVFEIGYRMTYMIDYFKNVKKICKYALKTVLDCDSKLLDKMCTEYKQRKNWFLFDGDVEFVSYKNKKIKWYSLYNECNDLDEYSEEYRNEKVQWMMTMFDCNPIRIIKKHSINYILYKVKDIKIKIKNIIKQYNNKTIKPYTIQDMINIRNEFAIMLNQNTGHDKLCNNILDLIIRVMNKGDTNVNNYLMELNNMYTTTRNKRRIKKQGFIGSLDMYNSRLGIEKTPNALHKLLF